mgnify:FL=1
MVVRLITWGKETSLDKSGKYEFPTFVAMDNKAVAEWFKLL